VSYTLAALRAYVREHLDVDATELTDTLLDAWAREGSTRVWRRIKRWEHFQETWSLPTVASQAEYALGALSPPVDEIVSIGADTAELRWRGSVSSGTSVYFSYWKGSLRLWPPPGSVETLQLRGYRKMTDWVAGTPASTTPDLPEEFHNSVRLWMLGSAYNQQEDPEQGMLQLDLFSDEVDQMARQANDGWGAQPLVLGGGPTSSSTFGRLRYPWE
jgi:hypothetical protein